MGGIKTIAVVGLMVFAVAMGVTVYAATQSATPAPAEANVVRAERFELVDSEGSVRAVLGLRAQPIRTAQRLRIVDPEGNVVVVPEESITTLDRGAELPYLGLIDDAGRTRIEVTFDWDGEPVIRLLDEDGRTICVMPPSPEFKMLGS